MAGTKMPSLDPSDIALAGIDMEGYRCGGEVGCCILMDRREKFLSFIRLALNSHGIYIADHTAG